MNLFKVSAFWLVMLLSTAWSAVAQDGFPTKPIRFIVPYSPGGITDIAARITGSKLGELLRQQVIVENKPGGNGTIGISTVVNAPADGYTLLVATGGDITLNPFLFPNIPYDVFKDLIPISSLTDTPMFLGTNIDSPYKSIADLVADAKSKPGKLAIASPGSGSLQQLAYEWFAMLAGVKFQQIPYKGGAPAAAAVAAGDVPLGSLAVASSLGYIKSGRINMLAQFAAKRSDFIPAVPTFAEVGFPQIDATNSTLMMAPARTPKPIVDKLQAEVMRLLGQADVVERLKGAIAVPVPATSTEVVERLKRDAVATKIIVDKAGMKLE